MAWAVDRLLSAYRRLGGDPPFGDPLLGHGVGMEGYYWRLTDPAGGRVVVALCGVCLDGRGGSWAAVAVAVEPAGTVVEVSESPAVADPVVFGARAGRDAFCGSAERLAVDLGPDARLDVRLVGSSVTWPRRAFGALGPAGWVPGLGQYWHPHTLGGLAFGELVLGGERVAIDGWRVYAEKNWGSAFPSVWWWGEAHDFGGADVCVAFAGGVLGWGVSATGVMVRVGAWDVVRLAPPTAVVSAGCDGSEWRVLGRGVRDRVVVDGWVRGRPCALPVPVPAEHRVEPRAMQSLAGGLRLTVRRGRRVLFRGESELAGLEYGS